MGLMLIMYITGIYKNFTEGLVSDALCDEVDLSQFCQHVRQSLHSIHTAMRS